ncbi:hypothetical protein WJX72_010422 [[Myrmecia] bisecta]|uniref:Uncharacterized protein n=1 Tax=[Myrmecia] bisecta TaxID=41462 RepID=A0AAW1Q9Z8_9CHLO
MLTVTTKSGAIGCEFVALVLLGCWGRHTAHTYADFSLAFLFVSIICAVTVGEIGPETFKTPNFSTQLRQENGPMVGFALLAGTCVQFGNFLVQYGCALVGVTITMPINASLIVIIGTTLNYFLDRKLNNAKILFPGVACFCLAVMAGIITHITFEKYKVKVRTSRSGQGAVTAAGGPRLRLHKTANGETLSESLDAKQVWKTETRSTTITTKNSTRLGILVCVVAGCCSGLFGPAFNVCTNDQFKLLKPGVPPLTVYTGYFYFCLAYIFWAFIETVLAMRFPPLGQPRTTWSEYIFDASPYRLVAFVGGLMVSAANVLQFLGGQAAGYAASDMVQANPLVSTLWGILFFREYHGANRRVICLLLTMYAFYIAATGLLVGSSSKRES